MGLVFREAGNIRREWDWGTDFDKSVVFSIPVARAAGHKEPGVGRKT